MPWHVLWASYKVAMGESGPLGHRQVLLKLLARRWLDCFGAVPAGRQFYRCDRPNEDLPDIMEGYGLRMKYFVDVAQGAAHWYGLLLLFAGAGLRGNSLHPLPCETVAARTRDMSISPPA